MASSMHQASRIIIQVNKTPLLVRTRTGTNGACLGPVLPTKRYYSDKPLPTSSRSQFTLAIGITTALALCGVLYTYIFQGDRTRAVTKPYQIALRQPHVKNSMPKIPTSGMTPVSPEELAAELLGQTVCRHVRNQANEGTLLLSPEQCSEILRRNEESFQIARDNSVVRYDRAQVASNDPIEDDYSEKLLQSASSDWMFWGIYDGHV